ncbi:hypothetical protein BDW66DRAFT_29583 [Aspergillus desertorum]
MTASIQIPDHPVLCLEALFATMPCLSVFHTHSCTHWRTPPVPSVTWKCFRRGLSVLFSRVLTAVVQLLIVTCPRREKEAAAVRDSVNVTVSSPLRCHQASARSLPHRSSRPFVCPIGDADLVLRP